MFPTIPAGVKPTVTATTEATAVAGTAARLYDALGTSQTLIDNVVTMKTALDNAPGGAVAKWTIEQDVYKTAENAHDTLVKERNLAQTTVNNLMAEVKSAEKAKTRTDMLASVAVSKYDTAKTNKANSKGESNDLYFQVGANAMQGLELSIGSVKSDMLGIGDGNGKSTINIIKDSGLNTTAILDVLDTALSYVTTERSRLGAAQNRMEYTIKSLDISSENLSASESRIRDTDMAKEMMNLTRANVLQQAATSMLAQANQAPQNVLQLLG